jgi:hypothetical protein
VEGVRSLEKLQLLGRGLSRLVSSYVAAAAERTAGTAQDDATDPGIVLGVGQCLQYLVPGASGPGRDGVEDRWSVKRDPGYAIDPFVADLVELHG